MKKELYDEVIKITTNIFKDCKFQPANLTDKKIIYEFKDIINIKAKRQPIVFNEEKLMKHKKELLSTLLKIPYKEDRKNKWKNA